MLATAVSGTVLGQKRKRRISFSGFGRDQTNNDVKLSVAVCHANASSFYFSFGEVSNWICVILQAIWRQT